MAMRNHRVIALLLFTVWSITAILANSLLFEIVTGSLTGLELDANHSSSNPEVNPYQIQNYTYGEYWSTDGFLGRYVYRGDPIDLTVTTLHPSPSTWNNGRFYYFHINSSGTNDLNSWKEYVLLFRIKGQLHTGGTSDFTGANIIIESPGEQIHIPVGAGDETVQTGEAGYDAQGNAGIFDGSNGFFYRYPYAYLWIDVTVLRTTQEYNISRRRVRGYYDSSVHIVGNGIDKNLVIEGYVRTGSNTMNPDTYSFGMQRIAPEMIPFTDLMGKSTLTNSYLAGHVSYNSSETSGSVGFYADSSGTSTDFTFTSTVSGVPVSIPYFVLFDPIICGNTISPVLVSSMNNTFTTDYRTVYSPVDGQQSVDHVLTGDIRLIVHPGITATSFPAASYSSTIYAVFTAD